jgi:Protein of unknown function (DUF2470)
MQAGLRRHASVSAAERVRTVLVAAGGAALTSLDARSTSVHVWLGEHEGRWLLRPLTEPDPLLDPPGTPAFRRAVLEVADAAPVPLRQRIRARVRLTGTLARDETAAAQPTWRLLPEQVLLDEHDSTHEVCLSDLHDARPDPFALVEGVLLGHLDTAHHDEVQTLGRLLEPHLTARAPRLRPARLDRHGLVLRVEYAGHSLDARLAFPAPVGTPEQMRRSLHELLTRARAMAF